MKNLCGGLLILGGWVMAMAFVAMTDNALWGLIGLAQMLATLALLEDVF